MLSEIRIQNFAIIDKLEMRLSPGFNVITGETGAGKSIIIDAVDLLLGGRHHSTAIRGGPEKAVAEGAFQLPSTESADIKALLESEGIDMEIPDEIVLTREVRTQGRSVCRINGSTVSLQFFRDVGDKLVDIHGQSEHLSLLKPREHIDLLDRYANLEVSRRALATVVHLLNGVRSEIDQLVQDEAALARRID